MPPAWHHVCTTNARAKNPQARLCRCCLCSEIGIANTTAAGDGSDHDLALPVGAIVGIVIGSLVFLLVVVFLLGMWHCHAECL
jgi:hypothetical protein